MPTATARDRIAIHDFGWSRARVDPALVTEAERTGPPPVKRAAVATENPNGPALYRGQHAKSIEGLNETHSRTLIETLMAFATNPGFVYSHRWRQGGVVVWDNRAVMHRATPFARAKERRHMVRTTASCPPAIQ
jgi:alpha-ketoglutarate-dependent 2,4-dichlorophenoxyacetate dioxygenase